MVYILLIWSVFPDYTFSTGFLTGNRFALSGNPGSALFAPALLSDISGFGISLSGTKPFGIPEMVYIQGGIGFGRKNMGFGLAIEHTGTSFYKEQTFALGFSLKESELITFGLNVKAFYLQIREVFSDFSEGFDINTTVNPLDFLKIGAFLRNVNNPKIGQEKITPAYAFAFMLEETKNFTTYLDVDYRIGYPVSTSISQKIHIFSFIDLFFGLRTRPRFYLIGLGIGLKPVELKYGFKSHFLLGDSHTYEIQFTR